MLSNKPEFIDPEEKNITYYYDRNKKKKDLEENSSCCSDRRGFLIFRSTKGRLFLIFFYLIVVLYLFLSSHNKFKTPPIGYQAKWREVNLTLSAYTLPGEKFYFQVLFQNQAEQALEIPASQMEITLLKKDQILKKEKIFFGPLSLSSKEIYNLKRQISEVSGADRIQISIFFQNQKVELEKKL